MKTKKDGFEEAIEMVKNIKGYDGIRTLIMIFLRILKMLRETLVFIFATFCVVSIGAFWLIGVNGIVENIGIFVYPVVYVSILFAVLIICSLILLGIIYFKNKR